MSRDLIDYTKNYLEQPYEKYQVKFRKRKILDFLDYYKPAKILEVGCGLESIFLEFLDFEKFVVIEPSEMFFKKANSDKEIINKSQKSNIEIYNVYFEDFLPLENFDFVIISSLIHEIVDLDKFISHLYKIINNDTIVHVNVPNAESFHRLIALELGLIKNLNDLSVSNKEFQQNRVFNLYDLEFCFKKYNFEIISSGSYSFKPFTHNQMAKLIETESVSEDIITNLFKIDKYLNGHGSEIFINIRKNK